MGDRETQIGREPGDLGVTVDPIEDEPVADPASADTRRGRLRQRAASLFAVRALLVATVACLGGFLLLGGVLPLGTLGDLLGIAGGSFLYGLIASDRRYAESAAAGGLIGGAAALLNWLVVALLGPGLSLVVLGATGGLLAGVVGHYFGRDLRAGLTADL